MRLLRAAAAAFVLTFALGLSHALAAIEPRYSLTIAFDPASSRLIGTATIAGMRDEALVVHAGELRITSVTSGGQEIPTPATGGEPIRLQGHDTVQIEFEGTFAGPGGDVINEDTIVLREFWYPLAEGDFRFALTATVPRGFHAISEADHVERRDTHGEAVYGFHFPYPLRQEDGITFVASRDWVLSQTQHGDIELSVYVLRDHAPRLPAIEAHARRYLARLEALLGRYPYRRLAIVENPLATPFSLSMPTYILLSQQSVRSATGGALKHEIAHAWFGNGVFVDYWTGNWCEGLATYFSDHFESEHTGGGWAFRQRLLASYQHHMRGAVAMPLARFSTYADRAANAVGYTKAEFVFHMLRRLVGDDIFLAAVRRFIAENLFSVASWHDIRAAFERESGVDLEWFFTQWLEASAVPELTLEEVSLEPGKEGYELAFTVVQAQVFLLKVPVTVELADGSREVHWMELARERERFRYIVGAPPLRLALDRDYDVMRKLAPAEMPPSLEGLIARERLTLLARPDEKKKFASLIDALQHQGTEIVWQTPAARTDVAPPDAPVSSLLVLGEAPEVLEALSDSFEAAEGGLVVQVVRHPDAPAEVLALVRATSKKEVDAAGSLVWEGGEYSTLIFDGGRWRSWGFTIGERGISMELASVPKFQKTR